jgi:HSP20 family protein
VGKDLIHLMHALFWPAAGTFRQGAWRPSADIYRTSGGWLVKLDLAGVRPEDVTVRAEGTHLLVRGARRDCLTEEGCNHYRLEITYSQFERRVKLPCDLRSATLATAFRDGMLLVHVETETES